MHVFCRVGEIIRLIMESISISGKSIEVVITISILITRGNTCLSLEAGRSGGIIKLL